ncbi:cytoskeleton-associated protein 2-like [Parambassis ranga]|uniref:Cytoskeleton-associated protein 2-like n=1 Tax=Parambassis ranga TaxID=210632 RepID=A0A6P7IYD6_9TELE|nr:cytoskeleton-associated protein 2-like [Parambassis ranga]
MEEGETVPILSRKDLRKKKLMEYLAAKGKLKLPSSKSFAYDKCQNKRPLMSALQSVRGKENKVAADASRCDVPKGRTSQARQDPVRRAFGVIDKVNTKGKPLAREQNTKCSSSTTGQAQPKCNVKPELTRTYTVPSSKSSLNAAGYLKKQPNLKTGTQTSDKPPLKGTLAVGAKSNSKFSSNGALSSPRKAVSIRMSLCPLVKTRTGLIPAVIQPRNATLNASVTAAGSIPAALKKVQSSTASSATQQSARAVSSTAVVRNNVQNRSNYKPPVGKNSQPIYRRQLSSGPKSTSSKCTAAPSRPSANVTSKKSAGLPADRSVKPRPRSEQEKNGQTYKVTFQTSKIPATRCSSTAASGNTRATLTDTKMRKEAGGKKSTSSVKAPAREVGVKRTSAPVGSQTAPQPSRTICLTGKTAKAAPQTEGKKLTTAQEERMKRLQEWRESKGISYKRPPMQVKPQVRRTVSVPQPFWTTISEEDEAHSLISAVDKSLADCIKLLKEGCPPDQVRGILSRLPAVSQKFAKYWICRARLMEQEGNLDVLPMFEEAVGVVLEPVDELRSVVFEILQKKDEMQASKEDDVPTAESPPECSSDPMVTPKPVKALIWGERGDSSVVKYKITATPGGSLRKQREPVKVNGQELRFFTPVRRSVRIDKASLSYPASLQDHDLCVTSYNDLLKTDDEASERETSGGASPADGDDDTPMFVYRENEALKDKMFVQLVFDDAV